MEDEHEMKINKCEFTYPQTPLNWNFVVLRRKSGNYENK